MFTESSISSIDIKNDDNVFSVEKNARHADSEKRIAATDEIVAKANVQKTIIHLRQPLPRLNIDKLDIAPARNLLGRVLFLDALTRARNVRMIAPIMATRSTMPGDLKEVDM